MRKLLLLAIAAFTLTSCGGGSVQVQGRILDAGPLLDPATGVFTCNIEKAIFDHRGITFRNESGTIIGRVKTGPGILTRPGGACSWRSSYTVDLPHATFYEAKLDGHVVWTQPVSFDTLKRNGFVWNLTP